MCLISIWWNIFFLQFALSIGCGLTIFLALLFPMNSLVLLTVLWITFLDAVFEISSPVFVAVFNICFHICRIDFLQMAKNHIF